MSSWRRLNKDRIGAVVLIVLGLWIAIQGSSYGVGALTRMGPGAMPFVLGTILAIVGLAIGVTAKPGGIGKSATVPMEWRGWSCVLGSVLAFVVLGAYGGFVPATFASVFVAAMGDRLNSWRDAAMLAVSVTAIGTLIFIYGLKIDFPLFAGSAAWN